MNDFNRLSLDFRSVAAAYADGLTPAALMEEIYRRIAARGDDKVWLRLLPERRVLEQAAALERRRMCGEVLPLYGLPYGVKDNIDVAGVPTTAGCPALGFVPGRSAAVVERLEAAGALLIGKQNLDQLATGVVGTRTLGGHCANAFDARYIPGGSSSGSAVAVAAGLVSFSIGSDTGGSGRVPAACNNIVGMKPTPGLVSTRGFLYNNRSFDVAPVLALTVEDAYRVFDVLDGYDEEDLYSIPRAERPAGPRFGEAAGETEPLPAFDFLVPRPEQLEFFGDALAERQYELAIGHLQELGGRAQAIDFAPFLEAGRLLFESGFLAERWLTYRSVIERCPEEVHPVVRTAIERARNYDAAAAFTAQYRLRTLQRRIGPWLKGKVLITPTVGTLPRCDEVASDPTGVNARMGYYTYFANPLRLAAISVPAGLRPDGLPFGLGIAAEAFGEARIGVLARAFERRIGGRLGATAATHSSIAGKESGRAAVGRSPAAAGRVGQPARGRTRARTERSPPW